MGEPATPSREEREERVALARGIVEAVRNDEPWPHPFEDGLGDDRGVSLADETAAVWGLAQECATLADRNAELLAAIRRITAETPTEDEAGIAAVLIAEVGTLKARIAELERISGEPR